ncbi:hypothetical protein [Kordiimonas aquimaris]|uniref:hypothetical protein n=1 Tax=Kordiimonas aquimaris TaxID=707591 RepID=UPI0021D395E5|nr:hypothetical protein [Kordiimonas aquimaris]
MSNMKYSLKSALILTGLFGASAIWADEEITPETYADHLLPPKCDYGTPHPSAPKELAQFSFLIGDYTINAHKWDGTQWISLAPPAAPARWNGWYGLGGMAIYDEWYSVDAGLLPDTPRGVNVRFYDEKTAEWKMMWTASGTLQPQDLRAEIRDGVLTMWQVYPDRPDFYAEFFSVDEDHWHRIAYGKDDNDEWVKTYKLAATRIACD